MSLESHLDLNSTGSVQFSECTNMKIAPHSVKVHHDHVCLIAWANCMYFGGFERALFDSCQLFSTSTGCSGLETKGMIWERSRVAR